MTWFMLLAACEGGSLDGGPDGGPDGDSAAPCDLPVIPLADIGQACVFGEYDQSVTLEVRLAAVGGCLGAVDVGCEATLEGERIEVTAQATLEESCEPVCPLDLDAVVASCALPELAEGTFTLSYGGAETAFDVPIEGGYVCVGETPSTY